MAENGGEEPGRGPARPGSLLPWALMTLMPPMLCDTPDNATIAPAGLAAAGIALAAPLVWAVVVVAAVEVVDPACFNLSAF